MITTYSAAPGIDVIQSVAALPGLGQLAVNAFVLHGAEPVLVDTGVVAERDEFLDALATVIDPAELRWVWLTHTDFDHIGALTALLAANPQLRVITTFFGVGIMGLADPLPMDQVHLLNPGERLALADRTLTAVKPPAFDNPITVGFHDDRTNALFSSDCFGALLDEVPPSAADLSSDALRAGGVRWATIDAPWLHKIDSDVFAADLARTAAIEPDLVCSSHLPPAPGAMLADLLESLRRVPSAEPFAQPTQAMLEQMLASMAPA